MRPPDVKPDPALVAALNSAVDHLADAQDRVDKLKDKFAESVKEAERTAQDEGRAVQAARVAQLVDGADLKLPPSLAERQADCKALDRAVKEAQADRDGWQKEVDKAQFRVLQDIAIKAKAVIADCEALVAAQTKLLREPFAEAFDALASAELLAPRSRGPLIITPEVHPPSFSPQPAEDAQAAERHARATINRLCSQAAPAGEARAA